MFQQPQQRFDKIRTDSKDNCVHLDRDTDGVARLLERVCLTCIMVLCTL